MTNTEKITKIENYLNSIQLPTKPIKLDQCTTITDLPKFIDNHIAAYKTNLNNPTYKPYLQRLVKLVNILYEKEPI